MIMQCKISGLGYFHY